MSTKVPTNRTTADSRSNFTCPVCGAAAIESLRNCPACQHDLGFPNVRAAESLDEVVALKARFAEASDVASRRGIDPEFADFVTAVDSDSHVVVAVPAFYAREFLSNPRTIYTNYESLVGAGVRTPASFQDDSHRQTVSAKLFGSYAPEIRYGVLSLNGVGLKSYGRVFLRLRNVAIEKRVSFLAQNSYDFVKNTLTNGTLPCGFRCAWNNRAQLAAAKVQPKLESAGNVSRWAEQLLTTTENREEDDFIEAHIYGGFNADAVESVEFNCVNQSRENRTDVGIIKRVLATRKPGGSR